MAVGVFEADGNGEEVNVQQSSDLSLVFSSDVNSGAAVKLQRLSNNGWRDVPEGSWVDSHEDIVYSGDPNRLYRLVCEGLTAGSIKWELSG